MDYSSDITRLLVLESNAFYLLAVMDSIAKDRSVSKDTINSLSAIGIDLESYTGISIRNYCHETATTLFEPTLEGIGTVLIQMGKKIIHLIAWLAKVLFDSIAKLFHWIKNRLQRTRLGLNKAKLMKELAPAITTTANRLGVSESAIISKITKTLSTAIPVTLSGGTVIPLNRTYVDLKKHYSVYFKESCLSKRQDKRVALIFSHLNSWIACGEHTNRTFKASCIKLNRSKTPMQLELPLMELCNSIPVGSSVPDGIDSFIKLSTTRFNHIDDTNRWNLFYTEAKNHHGAITALSAKDPTLVKDNKALPLEILEAYADFDVGKLEANLRTIEGLYKTAVSDGMNVVSTLSIDDPKALEVVIKTGSVLKYLILGIHHCSLSLNEYLSAVDVLQQLKYSILEDVRTHLRVA